MPRRLKSYFAKIASPRLHEGISRPFGAWNPSAFAVQVFDCKFGAVLTSQPSSNRSKKIGLGQEAFKIDLLLTCPIISYSSIITIP